MKFFFEAVTFSGFALIIAQLAFLYTYTHGSPVLFWSGWVTAVAFLLTTLSFIVFKEKGSDTTTKRVVATALLLASQSFVLGACSVLLEKKIHNHELGIFTCALLHILVQAAAAVRGHDIVRDKMRGSTYSPTYACVGPI